MLAAWVPFAMVPSSCRLYSRVLSTGVAFGLSSGFSVVLMFGAGANMGQTLCGFHRVNDVGQRVEAEVVQERSNSTVEDAGEGHLPAILQLLLLPRHSTSAKSGSMLRTTAPR